MLDHCRSRCSQNTFETVTPLSNFLHALRSKLYWLAVTVCYRWPRLSFYSTTRICKFTSFVQPFSRFVLDRRPPSTARPFFVSHLVFSLSTGNFCVQMKIMRLRRVLLFRDLFFRFWDAGIAPNSVAYRFVARFYRSVRLRPRVRFVTLSRASCTFVDTDRVLY